jgi:hypothetical protein
MKNTPENVNKNNYFVSKKQVVKNNYWNEEHEHILESLQISCFRLSKQYKQKYFKLRDTLQWYRIPIIIISSIGGFLSLSNSGYIPPFYNKWVSLFVGFTNLTVTIISLIESFKKIDTRMNGSYTTYINFQKLHDEISIIKRIPPNERDNNGNNTINNLFSKYESYFSDAPILRKLLNDDIGFNEFDELLTPQTFKQNFDIESHIHEFNNIPKKTNCFKNKFLRTLSSNINLKKNKKAPKTNFKSRYTCENFYGNYDFENAEYMDKNLKYIDENTKNLDENGYNNFNFISKQSNNKIINNEIIQLPHTKQIENSKSILSFETNVNNDEKKSNIDNNDENTKD